LAVLACVKDTLFPKGVTKKQTPVVASEVVSLRVASDDVLEYKQELARELVDDNHLDFSDQTPAGKLVNGIVAYAVQQVSKRVPNLKPEGKENEAFDAVAVAIAVLDKIRTKLKAKAVIEIAADEPPVEAEEAALAVVRLHNPLNGAVPVSVAS
jgi:hypothetical protein